MNVEQLNTLANRWSTDLSNPAYINDSIVYVKEGSQSILSRPTVGASGAVFGLLVAYGMNFPNSVIQLLFPPIPLKAKYFVLIYAALELYLGLSGKQPGVAHFAHLGGALFGFLIITFWHKFPMRFN
mgnify:CR=1 FL=1